MAMNDSQLITQADIIKNETATGANTAVRVGTMLDDIITNKINNDKIDVDGTFAANSDTLVASQKATKTYVGGQITSVNSSLVTGLALKEDAGNKSNGPLGISSTLFPTENSVSTALVPKENTSDKTRTQSEFIINGISTIKYPSVKSVKEYIDGAIVGLLRDNGNYDPTISGEYPSSADTLSGGVPQKGDLWFITIPGTINGNPVIVGDTVRALINGADPVTDADWAIASVGFGLIPEDSTNKSDDGTFNAGSPDHVLFPTQFAVATYLAANTPAPTLQDVLNNGHVLTNANNFQGDLAGTDMPATYYNINAFGEYAARFNSGNHINAFGAQAGGSADLTTPNGDDINAFGYNSAFDSTGTSVNAFGKYAAQGNTGDKVNALGYAAGINNIYSNVTLFGFQSTASGDDQLVFVNSGGLNAQISNVNLTANRKYELPNQSGTIALLSDINTSMQSTVVTLNNAAITAGTSIQILPAPGAGKFIDVISVKSIFTPGGTPLTSAFAYGSIQYGSAGFVNISGQSLSINGTNWFAQYPISQNLSQQLPFIENASINLLLSTPMTGGVGNTIKVYITYQTVTI